MRQGGVVNEETGATNNVRPSAHQSDTSKEQERLAQLVPGVFRPFCAQKGHGERLAKEYKF